MGKPRRQRSDRGVGFGLPPPDTGNFLLNGIARALVRRSRRGQRCCCLNRSPGLHVVFVENDTVAMMRHRCASEPETSARLETSRDFMDWPLESESPPAPAPKRLPDQESLG